MSRVQLALNVSDLDTAVAFYRKLFGTEPNKYRPGYANFAIASLLPILCNWRFLLNSSMTSSSD